LLGVALWCTLAGTAAGEPGTEAGAPPGPEAYLSPGGVGPSRGWYVWRHWNPRTREVEISRDPPGEVWKARVLPWATTYRYLIYGASPDELLPGERVNLFLAPDAKQPSAFVCHFQDELGQMKGHGHSWQIRRVDPSGKRFTASLHLAGEDRTELTELAFDVDRRCELWHSGERSAAFPYKPGDRIYQTWVYRGERRVCRLAADEASLDALRRREEAAVAKRLAREGLGARVEEAQGPELRLLVFSTYWAQARALKAGKRVQLALADEAGFPSGGRVPATVVSVQPGGPYGSGPVDVRVRLDAGEAQVVQKWPARALIRLVDPAPGA
jgi:hypothetical protein